MSLNFIDPSLDPRTAKWGPIREAPLHQLTGKPIAWAHRPELEQDAIVGVLDAVSVTAAYIELGVSIIDFPEDARARMTIDVPEFMDTWIGYWPETVA